VRNRGTQHLTFDDELFAVLRFLCPVSGDYRREEAIMIDHSLRSSRRQPAIWGIEKERLLVVLRSIPGRRTSGTPVTGSTPEKFPFRHHWGVPKGKIACLGEQDFKPLPWVL
jgi:hypothetical protein